MTATIVNSGFKEERWVQMMALSFCLHLAVFSTTLFIPQTTIPYPSIGERVYHVELVESPSRAGSEAIGSPSGAGTAAKASGVAKGKETSPISKDTTQRIAVEEKKAALIVARRVSPKPMATYTNKADSPSGLSRMSSGIGKAIQLYQMDIESAIKDNWSYPVALLDSRGENIPEAVVVVTVRSDGKILKIQFERKSQNALFDDSVLKAIEKSDPLSKFPPSYRKSQDEVEISFSLKDLVQY